MKRKLTQLMFGAALCVSALGCAADQEELLDHDADGLEVISQRLASAADIAHACDHARNPPGGSYISSSATSSASGSSPAWSEHVAYNITIPFLAAGSYGGWGVYTPDATAEHGIYTDPSVSVSVRVRNGDGSLGASVPQVWTTTLTTSNCPASSNPSLPTYGTSVALSRVRTFNLTSGQQYYVKLSHSTSQLLSIFENLDEQP